MGEESSPLGDHSANARDLHQGYIPYNGEGLKSLITTTGRMETDLRGQRLVGAVDWAQQGQSFDGGRLDVAKSWRTLALLFGAYATVTELENEHSVGGRVGRKFADGKGTFTLWYDSLSATIR